MNSNSPKSKRGPSRTESATSSSGRQPYTTTEIAKPLMAQAVSGCLDRMCTGNHEDTVKPTLELQELTLQEGFVEAMALQLGSENAMKRVFVAGHLRLCHSGIEGYVSEPLARECERILVDGLEHDSPFIRRTASGMIAQFPVFETALVPLRRQLEDQSEQLSGAAALALITSPYPEPRALEILNRSLDSRDEALAGMSAAALLRLGAGNERVLSVIKARFDGYSPFIQRPILVAAYFVGSPAAPLFNQIAPLVTDSNQENLTRQIAAMALGSITRGTDRATPALLTALKSADSLVFSGALDGLLAAGALPQKAVELLIDRLCTGNVKKRRRVAAALDGRLELSKALVPLLIQRLSEENDKDTLRHLALALSQARPLPELIECVRTGSSQVIDYAGSALVTIGEEAAVAVAELLPQVSDKREYPVWFNLIESMGARAGTAIPLLTQMLDEASEPQLIYLIVHVFAFCGPAAEPALPAVVRLCTKQTADNSDIRYWIIQTLRSYPRRSAELLRDMLASADMASSARLSTLLDELGISSSPPSRLAAVKDIKWINTFIALGDTLEAHGPLSMRAIGELLNQADGTSRKKRTGLSPTNLQRCLDELQGVLGEPLVHRATTNAIALTPSGRSVLQECREYVSARGAAGHQIA